MPTIDPNTTQKRTALELLQTILGELGLGQVGSILAGDDMTVQLLYLMNGLGSRLAKMPFWSELVEEWSITTTTAAEYDLPNDWGVPLAGTNWDRTARWPLVGPVTSAEWQVLKSGFGAAAPRFRFRFKEGQFCLHTNPEAGLTIVQEYLSTGWVLGLTGATATERKPRITADTDYVLLDEEMFICGVKLVWKEAKGLESSALLQDFKVMLEAAWGSSAGAPILSLAPPEVSMLLGYGNVPDTNYGT